MAQPTAPAYQPTDPSQPVTPARRRRLPGRGNGRPTRRPRSRASRPRLPLSTAPLRVRLVALLTVLLVVALLLTGLATSSLIRGYLMKRTDAELRQAAVPVATAAFQAVAQDRRGASMDGPNVYAVRIMPTDGSAPIYYSTSTIARQHPDIPLLSIRDPRVLSSRPFTVPSTDGDQQWRVIAGATQDGSATFAVAVSLEPIDDTVDHLRVLVGGIGLAATLICAGVGWYAVRRSFRPLRRIEDTAAGIAGGDLSRRVPEPTTNDEVASLSHSLNAMLAQIETSFALREASEDKMRQFVADASHELRTPLATVRGYAELYRQGAVRTPEDVGGAMSRIEDEAKRMGGLVEDLLLLTRLDIQRPDQYADVDLTVVCSEVVQDARVRAPERAITLVGGSGGLRPTVVRGDESRLRQVVTNLVVNAVNHTPTGTPIEVVVGSERPDEATITVRDHGSGIPPERAVRVFERFFRGDPSRSRGQGGGNGLGLAIVAAIVAGHRGRVGLAPTPGGGATFVVRLPSATSQRAPSIR